MGNKIKHIVLKGEEKKFIESYLQPEQSLYVQIATVGRMHEVAKKKLWEEIEKLYPQIKGNSPSLAFPDDAEEWIITYIEANK